MPTIFPGSAQEILDLGLHGFMLSRISGLWVGMKIVTNVADEVTTAEVGPSRVSPIIPTVELDGRPFEHHINVNLIPPFGLDMERTLFHARLELARRYASENKLNRITVPTPDAWLGIMTTGKTYFDVRQALVELGLDDEALRRHGIRILKMGMLFPMEPRVVREFARGLEEILVVEEKRAFLEMFAKDLLYGMPDRPRIVGRGAEGAQWVGISPFTETPHLFQNIGDGTLFHSGSLAINYAIAAGVNITYKILYNSAVAMTGGQDAAGALPIPALTRRLEADGVKRIIITTDYPENYKGVSLAPNCEVWHRDRLLEAQSVLAGVPGVTALIHDQQCAAEKRRLRKRGKQADPQTRVFINEAVCEGCGDCGRKSNCLSVQPVQTEFGRKTQIHQSSCNKDYSCLLGDCPSFLTVEPIGEPKKRPRRLTPLEAELPEPELRVPRDGFALHMMGIGGTGVVTVNQILGTAAMLDGRHVRGLDQTGLSRKGGPVVSDLRLASSPIEISNKVSAGAAAPHPGLDLLVATDPLNRAKAECE